VYQPARPTEHHCPVDHGICCSNGFQNRLRRFALLAYSRPILSGHYQPITTSPLSRPVDNAEQSADGFIVSSRYVKMRNGMAAFPRRWMYTNRSGSVHFEERDVLAVFASGSITGWVSIKKRPWHFDESVKTAPFASIDICVAPAGARTLKTELTLSLIS